MVLDALESRNISYCLLVSYGRSIHKVQLMSIVSFWAYLKHEYVLSGSSISMCCVILVYQAVYACGSLVHTWVTFRSESTPRRADTEQ